MVKTRFQGKYNIIYIQSFFNSKDRKICPFIKTQRKPWLNNNCWDLEVGKKNNKQV